jgi:hypothetical protein
MALSRLLEQFLARIGSAIAQHQNHIFVQDASHRRRIVHFDRRLNFEVEPRDGPDLSARRPVSVGTALARAALGALLPPLPVRSR